MKIIISHDAGLSAHLWERKSLARAFIASGFECVIWDIHKKSVYDCFDEQNPDIFIGQTYNIREDLIECIKERPALKVLMKASDYNFGYNHHFPILFATDKEVELTEKLREATEKPNFLFIHYHPSYIGMTHEAWIKRGFKVESLMNAADIFEYTNGVEKEEYKCDIGYVGGSWHYKNNVLHPYILPLCNFSHNVKIFGNGWSVPQSMGFLPEGEERNFYQSAKINLCLHEPHSQVLGFDVTEKFFKLAINKAFTICDKVDGLLMSYPEGGVYHCSSPQEMHTEIEELLRYWLDEENLRKMYISKAYSQTLEKHTYFDRAEKIMSLLELNEEAEIIKTTKQTMIEKLGL